MEPLLLYFKRGKPVYSAFKSPLNLNHQLTPLLRFTHHDYIVNPYPEPLPPPHHSTDPTSCSEKQSSEIVLCNLAEVKTHRRTHKLFVRSCHHITGVSRRKLLYSKNHFTPSDYHFDVEVYNNQLKYVLPCKKPPR